MSGDVRWKRKEMDDGCIFIACIIIYSFFMRVHFVSNFKGTYRSRRRRHGYALETSLTDATLSSKAFLVQ